MSETDSDFLQLFSSYYLCSHLSCPSFRSILLCLPCLISAVTFVPIRLEGVITPHADVRV